MLYTLVFSVRLLNIGVKSVSIVSFKAHRFDCFVEIAEMSHCLKGNDLWNATDAFKIELCWPRMETTFRRTNNRDTI